MTAPEPLVRPRNASVHTVRPMFQLLIDDGQKCRCDSPGQKWCLAGSLDAMRVRSTDYTPGAVFL